MNLKELQTEAYPIAVTKGWFDANHTLGDYVARVHSALSDAWHEYEE